MMETVSSLSSWRSCFEFGAVVFKTMALRLRETRRGGGGVIVFKPGALF
jgi:hypothetical protein